MKGACMCSSVGPELKFQGPSWRSSGPPMCVSGHGRARRPVRGSLLHGAVSWETSPLKRFALWVFNLLFCSYDPFSFRRGRPVRCEVEVNRQSGGKGPERLGFVFAVSPALLSRALKSIAGGVRSGTHPLTGQTECCGDRTPRAWRQAGPRHAWALTEARGLSGLRFLRLLFPVQDLIEMM